MRWFLRILVGMAWLAAAAPSAAQSATRLEAHGLELRDVEATVGESPGIARRITLRFKLRNVGSADATVPTRNLQTELWDYRDRPKEVHISISVLPVRDGRTVHPVLTSLAPATLKPGESVEVRQDHADGSRPRS